MQLKFAFPEWRFRVLFTTVVMCAAISALAQPAAEDERNQRSSPSTKPNILPTFTPLTPEQKFTMAVKRTVSPVTFLSTAASAGFSQARDTNAGFGQGAEGYGKRFGAKYANTASTQFFGTFLFPSLLRQDPRFFRKGSGTAKERIGYALTRTLVTRTDTGGSAPNASLWLGLGTSAAISNLYYPPGDKSALDAVTRFATGLGIKSGFNVLKEYWPDISRRVFKKKQAD